MTKTKKISLIVIGFVGLAAVLLAISFFQTVNSQEYKNAQKYYFKVPFIQPKGAIIFVSNRLSTSKTGMESHILRNGKISLIPDHVAVHNFLKKANIFISSFKGVLAIRDRDMNILEEIDVFKKYDAWDLEVSPDGKKVAFIMRDDPKKRYQISM